MTRRASPSERIARARSALVLNHPFFGCLALQLEFIESRQFDTMATDGTRLLWNPSFVDELTDSEVESVLAHEVLHCALAHHARMGARDPEQWNIATDYAINRDLVAAGFTLPRGALLDSSFGDASAEEIYRIRAKDSRRGRGAPQPGAGAPQPGAGAPQPGAGAAKPGAGAPQTGAGAPQPGAGAPQPGAGAPQPGAGDPGRMGRVIAPADPDASAAQWEIATRQAIAVAKAGGHVPAFAARMVQDLDRARVDWRDTLRRFIDDTITRDYSWTRPNRRFIGSGLILPGFVADGVAHIVAVVDTSGSIDGRALAAFTGELRDMLDSGAIARLSVLYADTRVRARQSFESGDLVALAPVGGGGTCFRDAMATIAADYPDASAVVYFTDMETASFGDDPGAPVMWACHGARPRAAPYGATVLIDPDARR